MNSLALKVLIGFFFGFFAFGCAPKSVDSPVVCTPPLAYLQEVVVPPFRGNTNYDLYVYTKDLEAALQISNFDKARLREWANGLQANPR
jgi:hypothetical protein